MQAQAQSRKMEKKQQSQRPKKKPEAEAKEPKIEKKRLALIRIRGKVHIRKEIKAALKHLNLNSVNHCAVVDNRESFKGMIQMVNNYITWGEIDEGTFKMLVEKRGRIVGDLPVTDKYLKEKTKHPTVKEFTEKFMKFEAEISDVPGLKRVYRLSPPVGGHERKGIKTPKTLGGVLGYRGKEINGLIARMI